MKNDRRMVRRGRHCMVVHSHYPSLEPRVERQARALVKNGYEVDVICLRGENEPAISIEEGVRVFHLPVKRQKGRGPASQLLEYLAFFGLAFARLSTLHRRNRYDVVQVHNLPDFLVFAALVPKLSGARLILDLHDLMPEFYASRFNSTLESWPVRLIRLQERLACRFADRVITVTDLWERALVERGVPAEKITVVMNVADDHVFNRSAVKRPAREDGSFRLIYHGTLTYRYGLDLAIRAIQLVREKIPEIHLTIHGIGEYRDALGQLTQELDLEEQVTFSTRALPIYELPRLIGSADLGIVPYRRDLFTDGILPTKLMEYAALGVPALVAQTPAVRAYFDETMVEFFRPGDVEDLAGRICHLYENPARLRDLARNSARFTEQYSWPAQAASYVRLVDRLAGRNPRLDSVPQEPGPVTRPTGGLPD